MRRCSVESRPKIVKDEHLTFLDELRETGAINMFGAAPYLAEAFEMNKQEARRVLMYWMETFGEELR